MLVWELPFHTKPPTPRNKTENRQVKNTHCVSNSHVFFSNIRQISFLCPEVLATTDGRPQGSLCISQDFTVRRREKLQILLRFPFYSESVKLAASD